MPIKLFSRVDIYPLESVNAACWGPAGLPNLAVRSAQYPPRFQTIHIRVNPAHTSRRLRSTVRLWATRERQYGPIDTPQYSARAFRVR